MERKISQQNSFHLKSGTVENSGREISYTEVEEIGHNSYLPRVDVKISQPSRGERNSPSDKHRVSPKVTEPLFSRVKHEQALEQESTFRPRCSTEGQVSLLKRRPKFIKNTVSRGQKKTDKLPIANITMSKSRSPIEQSLSPEYKQRRIEESNLVTEFEGTRNGESEEQQNEEGFRQRLYSESYTQQTKKRQDLKNSSLLKSEKEYDKCHLMVKKSLIKSRAFSARNLDLKQGYEKGSDVKILIQMEENRSRSESDHTTTAKIKTSLRESNSCPDCNIPSDKASDLHLKQTNKSKIASPSGEIEKHKGAMYKEMQFLELPRSENHMIHAFENIDRRSVLPILPPINKLNCSSEGQLSSISDEVNSVFSSGKKSRSGSRLNVGKENTNVGTFSPPIFKSTIHERRHLLERQSATSSNESIPDSGFRRRLNSDSKVTRKKNNLNMLHSKDPFRPRCNTNDVVPVKRNDRTKNAQANVGSQYVSETNGFGESGMTDTIKNKSDKKSTNKRNKDMHGACHTKPEGLKTKTTKVRKNSKSGRPRKSSMVYDRHPFDEVWMGSTGEPSDISSTPTEIPTRTPEPDLFKEFSEFDDGTSTPSLSPNSNSLYRPRYCWCTRCQIMYNLYKNDDERLEEWGKYPCFKF